ncbi:hypothetical protein [Mangrovicoccus sp. HB161399]|uniref:hypothetical protein n=1 Tax=Mangrovicoccus sp. HB161399 TaxID=2720392 RepID=UPI001552ED26|nr:hypothetical protein [Mangrovicoccus sp. HB161399]
MRSIAISLLCLGCLALLGGAAHLTLRACALDLPRWMSVPGACPAPAETRQVAQLARLDAQRSDLLQRIALAESQLSRLQCDAAGPDPHRALDPADWRRGDLEALYGCWDLSTLYQTRNTETGDEVGYPAWQICFDAKGNGLQKMRDMDGVACEGPVKGGFTEAGALQIEEAENLPCGDGGYIHRREFTCTATAGAASCDTLQPETGGRMAVEFRRSAREI